MPALFGKGRVAVGEGGSLPELTTTPHFKSLKGFAAQASQHANSAVQAGASALVYSWASGKRLNAAKAKLERGDFGAWREKNLGAAENTQLKLAKVEIDKFFAQPVHGSSLTGIVSANGLGKSGQWRADEKTDTCVGFLPVGVNWEGSGYFFTPAGGIGTRAPLRHLLLPEFLPVSRPLASR